MVASEFGADWVGLGSFSAKARAFALKIAATAVVRACCASHLAVVVILAFAAVAPGQSAQEKPAGGTQSITDAYSDACTKIEQPNLWKQLGVDPMTCHPETAPEDSSKQCSLSGMTMVAHISETCYYCAENDPPVVLRIPLDTVWAASQQNFSCGEDPTDNCFALCSSEGAVGLYIPPTTSMLGGNALPPGALNGTPCDPNYEMGAPGAAPANTAQRLAACQTYICQRDPQLPGCVTLTLQGGVQKTSTGSGPSNSVPSSGTPCEPNYDMSTPVGQAAAQAGAAQTQAACQAYRCQHNPELAGCGTPKGGVDGTNGSGEQPSAGLPLPLATRQAVLQAAAQMDQLAGDTQPTSLSATDHFFKCLAEAVSADLKFLAQPGYVPIAQVAKAMHNGVWDYLNSNAYKNNLEMFAGVQNALNSFKQDPACALANVTHAVAIAGILSPTTTGTGIAAQTATATQVAETAAAEARIAAAMRTAMGTTAAGTESTAVAQLTAAAEAQGAQNAAKFALQTASNNAKRVAAWGVSAGKQVAPNALNRFNPTCQPNMCFPSALAQDLAIETGEPLTAQPFAGNVTTKLVNSVSTQVFNVTHDPTIHALLGDLYQNVYPLGSALSPDRMANQLKGIPSPVASATDVLYELGAQPGARALIFLEDSPIANSDPLGHVINGYNDGGVLHIIDASNNGMDATTFLQNASNISVFRTR